MIIPKSLLSRNYPDFIRNNDVIVDNPRPGKIFPSIGLKNSSIDFNLNKIVNVREALKIYLKQEIYPLLVRISKSITKKINDNYWNIGDFLIQYKNCNERIKNIVGQIKNNLSKLIVFKNNKYNIILLNGIDLFQELKNIFNNHSRYVCELNSIIDLNLSEFDDLLALQNDNLKISFSSAGNKGYWDIATMSMRGIESCQKWSSNHGKALIGSLVDPYAGVIYICSNHETGFGPKMIRRSVVRYVINRKTMKPAILIERIYPFDYESRMAGPLTLTAFTNYIHKKTKGKFEIQYGEFKGTGKYSIPLTTPVRRLMHNERSYRDSNIGYRKFKDLG